MAFSPRDVLARNKVDASKLVQGVGLARTRTLLEASQRQLEQRIREAIRGPGAGSFTAEQLKTTLAQVRSVLGTLTPGMRDVLKDTAGRVAETAANGVVRYLESADKEYRGIGTQPLALREAQVLDAASQGAQSSVLRRLASSGEPVRGADGVVHPAKIGILQRYGMSVIQSFEDVLQQGVVTRKSFEDVKADLVTKSPFLQGQPAFWAERIVRTEMMGAYNRGGWEAQNEVNEQLGDMLKILSATFDDRTSADSYAVHGQIRRPQEAFETWQGFVQHPPARPNDREIVVPHRLSWPYPDYLRWKSDGEIAARWRLEGRKAAVPKRPKMTTVPLTEFGRGSPGKEQREEKHEEKEQPKEPEVAEAQEDPKALVEVQKAEPESPRKVQVQVPARVEGPSTPFTKKAIDSRPGRRTMVSGPIEKAAPQIFGTVIESLEDIERLFTPSGLKVKAVYVGAQHSSDQSEIDIRSDILGEDGARIGDIHRTFTKTKAGLVVKHDLFELPEELQGQHLGEDVLRRSIGKYWEMGVKKIKVSAAWIGRYTWARFGFSWPAADAQYYQDIFKKYLMVQEGMSERDATTASKVARTAHGVASFQIGGKKVGKEFLLSPEMPMWDGSLDLDEKSPGYQVAKKRLGL